MRVLLQIADAVWLLLAVGFLLAFCIYKLQFKLPGDLDQVFQNLIRYGKTKTQIKRPGFFHLFDVPKRWFWHFYAVSVLWNGLLLLLSLHTVFFHRRLPQLLIGLLVFLTGQPKTAWSELQLTVVVVQALLWIHSLRRLLECLYVSIFSDGVINIIQYAFGLSYYIFLGLTVLCLNVSQHAEDHSETSVLPFTSQFIWLIAGVILFIWASLLQHQSLSLLAGLRTSNSGLVETLVHRVPCGGGFELVSCPHYFAELLIYVALCVCCGCCCLTWWLVVLYVFSNQLLAASLCHDYYIKKFKAYPSKRKAFIPFLL